MKVLVVGAGSSGLVTMKELQDEGHEFECIESCSYLGGVFFYDENKGGVYDSTLLTVSNYFMAFSSFPPAESEPRRFWTHTEYLAYLRDFAEHFQLSSKIQYNTSLTALKFEPDRVVATLSVSGRSESRTYDAVAICTGTHQLPNFPTLEGQEDFEGDIVHSYNYKNAKPFAGKKVVCIGLGETGADVVHEISQTAEGCLLSLRRYPAVVERFPEDRGFTNDSYSSRHLYSFDREFLQYFACRRAQTLLKKDIPERKKILFDWVIRSKGMFSKFLTKNDVFLQDIADGRVETNFSGIARLEKHGIVFQDGRRCEADTIVCCTGYRDDFPFLERKIDDIRSLFKHQFHPDLGHRVAFIGWARPAIGGTPTCIELQARYFALLLSGKKTLPANIAELIQRDKAIEDHEFENALEVRTLVRYDRFCDSLADLIGCRPTLWKYVKNPGLWAKLWLGSLVSFQYRLEGPHAKPHEAAEIITKLPIAHPIPDVLVLGPLSLLYRGVRPLRTFLTRVSRKNLKKLVEAHVE